jgi:hypothetical protein
MSNDTREKVHKAEAALGAASEIVKRGAKSLGNAQAQSIASGTQQVFAHHGAGRAAATATGAALTGIAHAAPAIAAVATAAAPLALVGLIGWGLYHLIDD